MMFLKMVLSKASIFLSGALSGLRLGRHLDELGVRSGRLLVFTRVVGAFGQQMSQHETAGGARANHVVAVLRGIRQKVQVVPREFHGELPVAFQEAWHPAAFMVRAVDVDAVVLEHFHRRPGYLREDIPGRAAGEVGDLAAGRRVRLNVAALSSWPTPESSPREIQAVCGHGGCRAPP